MQKIIGIWRYSYLRLIGNSGFLFTIYIAIVVGSFYYSELLKWLPNSFLPPYF
ncbi:ABC transporter permease [Anaerobacillus sp. HL2]|nr:ABC transporter permease [Anaerobacillus sp. HL2]